MSAPHTLTIEYIDAQGQVQRTEQLSGEHFTLRVQSEALSLQTTADKTTPADLSPEAVQNPIQRIKPWLLALILFGIFALLTAIDQWIEYSPDDAAKNLVTQSLGMIGAIALWAAFWALLGKIFAKHAHYWQHICLVLGAGIVLTVIIAAMHFTSFSFSWRALGKMDLLITVAALSLLAWAHLRLIVPHARHLNLRLFMIVFTLSSVALLMWTNHRRQGTVLDRLHAPHLYRPALQFSSPSSSQDFFKQAASLEATLKARAQETEPGEDSIEGED
jgi:cation transport ATPase